MTFTRLDLPGLMLIELTIRRDARGFFMERFQAVRFAEHGLPAHFAQDNHSRSLPGVLRGLHYQHDPPQGKLIGVTHGRIWDVSADIRPESPTFGKHLALELSADNGRLLWAPPGFAHGFCVMGDDAADVLYKTTTPYDPAGEGGIRWDDPELAIAWPLAQPILSERDRDLETFAGYKRRVWENRATSGMSARSG